LVIPEHPTVEPRIYSRLDMVVPRVVTADDLRSQLGRELDQLRSSQEVLFVTKRGRLAAVLIDVEHYRSMVERAEYLEDSLAALQAREEADLAIPWSKVRK
jgi:prevent-host-death family protein